MSKEISAPTILPKNTAKATASQRSSLSSSSSTDTPPALPPARGSTAQPYSTWFTVNQAFREKTGAMDDADKMLMKRKGGVAVMAKPRGILKVVELSLNLICLIIWRKEVYPYGLRPFGYEEDGTYLYVCTVGGYLLITSILLITYLKGDRKLAETITEILFNFMGFLLHVASGAVAIEAWKELRFEELDIDEKALAMGGITILNGFVYLADTVCAVKFRTY